MTYKFYYIITILVSSVFLFNINAQELIRYDKNKNIAKVHYNIHLAGIHHKLYKKVPDYPKIGSYSPTLYGLQGVKSGTGVCNYIYIFQLQVY